jgi:hypothetical protein
VERSYLPLCSPKILGIAVVGPVVRYVNHRVCHPVELKPFAERVLLPEVRTLSEPSAISVLANLPQ